MQTQIPNSNKPVPLLYRHIFTTLQSYHTFFQKKRILLHIFNINALDTEKSTHKFGVTSSGVRTVTQLVTVQPSAKLLH